MTRVRLALALLMMGASGATANAAETHPFNVRDMQGMDRVSEPRVSPDGKQIVFVVTTTDLDANKHASSLWRMHTDGTGLLRLTSTPAARDSSPRWSPDGASIYFLSSRTDPAQVWRISLAGGEAEKVTDEPLDVDNLAISPDGTKIAYSMDAFVDCSDAACTKKRLDELAAKKSSGKVYDSLLYRHWDSWSNGTRTHLFVRDVKGGASKDVTKGVEADVPSKPFGGPEEYTFTPDSKSIVYAARVAGREEAWSTNFDLFEAPIDGSAPARNLTAGNLATDTQPSFSPDGKTLAYLAMSRAGFESDRLRVVLKPWPAGPSKVLTEAWDRSPNSITWSRDGKALLTTSDNLGHCSLFSINAATGAAKAIVAEGTSRDPSPAGDRVVFTRETMRVPAEIYSVKNDGSGIKALTTIDAAKVAATRMGDMQTFTFAGAKGDTVHGWIIKPVDFDASKKYPIAFLIHGGPQGSWQNDFHYRWNPEIFAGAGYAVVMVDFHGSTGYGQAFTDAIRDDWGGAPLVDLQKGLAAAIAQSPWMDGDRACALGASYGGWMIDWIQGAWPDRFKCLVSHDGNIDERMAYYDTEELWFPEWEHKGTPWDNAAGYAKASPIEHVAAWKTPMLVIHGGLDYRVVDTEGLASFTALQRRGIPSKLLYFPDENHWVRKPQNSVLWYDTVLAWTDKWTKPQTAAHTSN